MWVAVASKKINGKKLLRMNESGELIKFIVIILHNPSTCSFNCEP